MEPNLTAPSIATLVTDNPPTGEIEGLSAFNPGPDDIIGKEFNPPYRFIFGQRDFSEKEVSLINELKKSDLYASLDPFYWNDEMVLRYIQGCAYNLTQAKDAIAAHDEWRRDNIRLTIDPDALSLLVFSSERRRRVHRRPRRQIPSDSGH